ncbi:MAG: Gfo/Idh/MocA family oxidoreductase [Clostridia bacterium]|nr:Gfo/Idh/MocA family oxidoreductase [Clostridia bacterium]
MKLAILGTGKIVNEALYAIEPLAQIERRAILARPHSRQKGEALADRYSIAELYTDYDELLDRADVDTVYIGLINSVHFEYAKRALEKQKHVILEKPFTGMLAEAEELVELARAQNRFVLEAITVLHNDVIDRMRETLPKLGSIHMLLANYSQYSSRYDRYLRGDVDASFDPASLGGALRDINIYNIHYAVSLFGAPKRVQYFPNRGFNGIDISGTLVMEYNGFSAVCTGAKDSDSPCFVSVQGEKGYMKIDGKPNASPNLTTAVVDEHLEAEGDPSGGMKRRMNPQVFQPKEVYHRMTREFQDFARIIDTGDAAAAKQLTDETLNVMRVIDMVEWTVPTERN